MKTVLTHPRAADERGSLPLAMLAVIIVGALVAALFATTLAGQRSASFDREYTTVIQAADAGVQEALSLANRQMLDDVPVNADQSGSLENMAYTWRVVARRPLESDIESVGVRNGVQRRVLTTIADVPQYTLAAYAETRLTFRGSSGARSYNSETGGWNLGNGIVATNGEVRLSGGSTGVDIVELHNWEAYPSAARCVHSGGTSCDNPVLFDAPLQFPDRTAEIRARVEQCLVDHGGVLPDWRTSVDGPTLPALASGDVLCVQNLILDADTVLPAGTTRTSPLRIYVRDTVSIRNGVKVNCGGCGTTPPAPAPDAGALQLFLPGPHDGMTGEVLVGNHSAFGGTITALNSVCRGNPSNAQSTIFGSLLCREIGNQGGWTFMYDEALMSLGSGEFRATEWREE